MAFVKRRISERRISSLLFRHRLRHDDFEHESHSSGDEKIAFQLHRRPPGDRSRRRIRLRRQRRSRCVESRRTLRLQKHLLAHAHGREGEAVRSGPALLLADADRFL